MNDSPNCTLIVSGSSDGSVVVINYETGEIVAKLKAHSASVECVSFNASGEYFVSASLDGTLKVWDMSTIERNCAVQEQKPRSVCQLWMDSFVCCRWFNLMENRSLIVTASLKGSVQVLDARNGEIVSAFACCGAIQSIDVSSDDKYAVCVGDEALAYVFSLGSTQMGKNIESMINMKS